jgi:excisionase family DNA binding protein
LATKVATIGDVELSLAEAARLLGKSERQVRYLLQTGALQAQKRDGHWRIRREDLPLSERQEAAAVQKSERAARLALEVLQPREGQQGSTRRRYSVRELRAYQEGAPLYRDLVETAGPDHPAAPYLREALMLLACGCHEFQTREKAAFYSRAREQASRAVMALLLEGAEALQGLVERFETALLPAIGGLIRQAEHRGRGR